MKPILVDLNKNSGERILLTCVGTLRDLERQNIKLENGLRLWFYDSDVDKYGSTDNLIFEGIVKFDEELQNWVAEVNWNEIKNMSRLSAEERRSLCI